MLTKKQRVILKRLILLCSQSLNGKIEVNYTKTFKNISSAEVENTLICLSEKGLITLDKSNLSARVRITPHGDEYFDLKKAEQRNWLKKMLISKWADVLVAFVTAAITASITSANWNHIEAFFRNLFTK